jgi:hypothetical protein
MATPAPAPTAAPTAPAAPELKPGYLTSEGWLSFLTILIGALPTLISQSGLLKNTSPMATQIVGLIISGLSAIHFTSARKTLKLAHLANATAANANRPATVAGSLAVTALLVCGFAFVPACGTGAAPTLGQLGSDVGSAALAGLDCEGVDLEAAAGIGSDGNLSVLSTVALDLFSGNWVAAIDAAITELGKVTVGCAILALEDIDSALKTQAQGSAAIATGLIAPGAVDDILARITQLKNRYGWKRAPYTFKRKKTASAFRAHDAIPMQTAEPVGEDGSTYRKMHRMGSAVAP